MRDLTMQNDPGAPIEATASQKSSIEGRRDIIEGREAYRLAKLSGDRAEITKANGALDQRRRAFTTY